MRPRILDWDGFPHNADTGEPIANAESERQAHWIDELPATSLDGLKLDPRGTDMVMDVDGVWRRRDELRAENAREANRLLGGLFANIGKAA